jgi:pyruvoyl-dependent arginine decarboxylase (PvlArgDC)
MIVVCTSKSRGRDEKLAFDNALQRVNLHNYNLVEYSSVIPSSESVSVEESLSSQYDTGQPIGCVLSKDIKFESDVVSSLGWWNSDKGGVFVEFSGDTYEDSIVEDVAYNRDWDFRGSPENVTSTQEKIDNCYSCALCVAVYGEIKVNY